MPCRISTGVHEGINEGPTVPAKHPVNPQPGEQSRDSQREEKTPWSFTAAYCWDIVVDAERRWEPLIPVFPGTGVGDNGTPPIHDSISNQGLDLWDNGRWAVWLGRHALEKISRAPKGQLRRVRNPS